MLLFNFSVICFHINLTAQMSQKVYLQEFQHL